MSAQVFFYRLRTLITDNADTDNSIKLLEIGRIRILATPPQKKIYREHKMSDARFFSQL